MGVATTTHAQRRALERAEKLAEVRRQVEAGEVVIRQATAQERASWPPPLAPLPEHHAKMAPRLARRRPPALAGRDLEALHRAVVELLQQAAPLPVGAVSMLAALAALHEPCRVSLRRLRLELAGWAAAAESPIVRSPTSRGYTVSGDGS